MKPGSELFSGDIAVSENTVHKFITTSDNLNTNLWRAYSNSKHLWNQNLVNGEYIIAYEINSKLDQKLKSLLPTVTLSMQTHLILPVAYGSYL